MLGFLCAVAGISETPGEKMIVMYVDVEMWQRQLKSTQFYGSSNTLFYSEYPVLESFQLSANNNAVAYSGIILAHQALDERIV
jgi:hypothetical protein